MGDERPTVDAVALDVAAQLKVAGIVGALALVVLVLTQVASAIGALDQIRTFFGWQSTADGIKLTTETLADLEKPDGAVAGEKWAIDRLVVIARAHDALRPAIARHLADYIRARSTSSILDSLTMAVDAADTSLFLSEYRRVQHPRLGDDVVQYAFRVLGTEPFVGVKLDDDEKLDLRGVVIPELLARNRVFKNFDLSGALLPSASMNSSRFVACNLSGVRFTASAMPGVSFEEGTSLRHAVLRAASLHGGRFTSVSLLGADFQSADLSDSAWEDTRDAREVNWRLARLERATGPDSLIAEAGRQGALLQ